MQDRSDMSSSLGTAHGKCTLLDSIEYSTVYRGVSGSLKLGGQVVMRQLWRRAAAAGGAFYSTKRWGAIAPPSSYAPVALCSEGHFSEYDK